MSSSNKEVPKLNGFVALYTSFAIVCVVIDYFKLAEFYLVRENNILHLEISTASLVYNILSACAIAGLLVIVAIFLGHQKYKELPRFFYFPQINKTDWVAITFLFAITLLRLPIPDRSFDVLNYHLILQDFGFENNLTYNFFPGNLQTFTFPLGDRLFYGFRFLLGYRGGVILNTMVLSLLFIQVKELLNLNEYLDNKPKYKEVLLSVLALFVLSTEWILANIGTYMIDLLMLPFLVELTKTAFGPTKAPRFSMSYSGLMIGLSLSMKFTTIIFCALLFFVIFIRYYKEASFGSLITSSLLIIFPLACYIIYNVTQTHNPIFPFFNSLFKSPYYPLERFPLNVGPTSIYETLIWPFYIFFHPQRTVELGYYSGRLGIGFLVAFVYTGNGLLMKKRNQVILGSLVLALIYLWVISSGAIRYGLFIEIALGILIVHSLHVLFDRGVEMSDSGVKDRFAIGQYNSDGRKKNGIYQIVPQRPSAKPFITRCLIMLMTLGALTQSIYAYYLVITNRADWASRVWDKIDWQTYLKNIKMIGRDYVPMQYGDNDYIHGIIDEIDVWVVNPGENISGYAKLLKGNVPILNLQRSIFIPHSDRGTEITHEIFLSLVESTNLRSRNVYMLSQIPLDLAENNLNIYGFSIVDAYEIRPTFTFYPLKLIKVTMK